MVTFYAFISLYLKMSENINETARHLKFLLYFDSVEDL